MNKRLREGDLQTLLEVNRWNADDLTEFVGKRNADLAVPNQSLFAFRERAGFFGNNAPPRASLRDNNGDFLFADDWDSEKGWQIWNSYPAKNPIEPCLERSVPGIVQNSWAAFSDGVAPQIYRVVQTRESSVVGFGMSGKTTVLTLLDPDKSTLTQPEFLVRSTTAWVKSEPVELAALPVSDFIDAGIAALELDEMILGLRPGQLVVLTGEQRDAPGVIRQELLSLQEIIHRDGRSTILFREESAGAGLLYSYIRKTVKLNANVARATHGETRREVLGSGDASQSFQKFLLKQAPLTYVSAPTATGLASTLQLRVNDILWDESPTLYRRAPSERIYLTRRSDEGKTTAQFGDGVTGARACRPESRMSPPRIGSGSVWAEW